MKKIHVSSWEEAQAKIEEVRAQYPSKKILFRGQSNESWKLQSTLERKTSKEFDVFSYLILALRARNEIEAFTGKRWDIPDVASLEQSFATKAQDIGVYFPAYDYLAYLRQHGFPSPLLDWSESPNIAAYFAFSDCDDFDPAIYCYVERPNDYKWGDLIEPVITVHGPYVTADKRHFSQRAWYTVSTRFGLASERHIFSSHENVFDREHEEQDVLIKIIIPKNEKMKVLKSLYDFNINHYTLFLSEDSLIKSLEFKTFDLP
jgi:UDP:flavonoid glycosyltransferase YjiC (YdhE family)